jgi:hypothetical protein
MKASAENAKRKQPSVDYQFVENSDGSIERAFDILFEEILRQNDDLTSIDNSV